MNYNHDTTDNNEEFIKDSCEALKRISSEHEELNTNFRKERRKIRKRCVNFTKTNTEPLDLKTFEVIAKKVDELRVSTPSCATNMDDINRVNKAAFSLDTSSFLFYSNTLKAILSNCENKCHEILTQLANVDFILNECVDSLEAYHIQTVNSMIEYNLKLSCLYKRRSSILMGYSELPQLTNHQKQVDRSSPAPVEMPEFWLKSITTALNNYDIFQPEDRIILSYLSDVRYYYNVESTIESLNVALTPLPSPSVSRSSSPLSLSFNSNLTENRVPSSINSNHRSQLLLFFFRENPYFSDNTLTKKLYIDKSRLKTGREMYDKLWVTKKEGCSINWYEGRDITKQEIDLLVDKKPKRSCSFFEFFTEEGFNNFFIERRDGKDVELDYQVFSLFRDEIVPHAVVAYCRGDIQEQHLSE